MLALDNTGRKLEIILAGSVSANQPMATVTYRDVAMPGGEELEGSVNVATNLANGATAVTILPAPTQSVRREIENITIYNADTASVTATVRINDGTNTYTLFKTTMVTLGNLVYERGEGWVNYSAAGVRA